MSSTPRSLILDLFGDYLRYVGASVRLADLTALMGEFDVAPATVRVTVSRLRKEGWFTSQRSGREVTYRLSEEMLRLLDRGRPRIFAPAALPWDGSWTMVLYQLSESERALRDQMRKQLAWQGFGPLTTSTWLAPGDRAADVLAEDELIPSDRIDVLHCRSTGLEHDRSMAERCWDLVGLARRYEAFNARHAALVDEAGRLEGAAALVARTRLVAEFREFPFLDPRLPVEIRPDPWPGEEAHRLFADLHERLGAAARAHVSSVVGETIPRPEDVEVSSRTPA